MKPQKKDGVASKTPPKSVPAKTSASAKAPVTKTRAPAAAPKTKTPAKPQAKAKTSPPPPPVARRKPAAPKARPAAAEPPELAIPPILLEGDEPNLPPLSGPGQRYALGPTAPVHAPEVTEELPESYGTGKLLLTARDPHWLYAHWDLTSDQMRAYNAQSVDHHLVLRIHVGAATAPVHTEVHVHPESRNWFVHVGLGSTRYVAVLGFYTPWHDWETVAISQPTLTPPDAVSEDTTVQFATIPIEVPFRQLVELVKAAAAANVPLAEAILQLRAAGYEGLPEADAVATPSEWTPRQEQALAKILSMDTVRRVWIGSLEITELVRRQLAQQVSSLAGVPTSPMGAISSVSSISSPFGGVPGAKGFWFNVNAELIVYGATEPDATVTIGSRTIRLRADGSFSYRFALPDGQYLLPITATSVDGDDQRNATLSFSRATDYRGDVGTHPQDSRLKPPAPANVD